MQRILASALLILLFLAVPIHAALPATAVWEIRTTGDNNNGGCFNSAKIGVGTDYSQQNSNQYTFTDLVLVTGTTLTSASHSFVTADEGNCIHITAGVNFTPGWYMINSTASGVATIDRSAGTGGSVAGTYFVGGALATLAQFQTNGVNGNTAWVKATATYSITASISFTYGNGGGTSVFNAITGYTTTRGDGGQVTIQYNTGVTANGIVLDTTGLTLTNFILDCNNLSNISGLNLNQGFSRAVNVKVQNCIGTSAGITFTGDKTTCINCVVTASSATNGAFRFSANSFTYFCYFCSALSNSTTGFNGIGVTHDLVCIGCIAGNNSGAASDGFGIAVSAGVSSLISSTAYNNGRDGVRFTGLASGNWNFINNISYGNAGKSFNYTNGAFPTGTQFFNYNAYQSGTLTNYTAGPNDVTLTADPFVNGAANNFALNSTAGGGLAVRAAGFPGVLAMGGTGYLDIGALQFQAAAVPGAVAIGFSQ